MRRFVPFLATAALALGVPITTAGSASAFGGEYLGCTITPGGYSPAGDPSYCESSAISQSFGVTFSVQGGSGSYTYAWSLPTSGGAYTVWSGCTATSSTCVLSIGGHAEHILVTSVVVTQNGQSETLTAEADTPAVCGNVLC